MFGKWSNLIIGTIFLVLGIQDQHVVFMIIGLLCLSVTVSTIPKFEKKIAAWLTAKKASR